MKIQAAASLTCLLFLGGCTYSSIVSKLTTKPAAPRAGSAPADNAAPRTATAPRDTAAPGTAPASRTVAPQQSAAPQAAAPAVTTSGGRPALGIAPEQIPSPGECRVWMPERAPEEQSPSGSCTIVQQKVPAGAWVLHRSVDKSNEVAVNVYRSRWPKLITETRYFDYWTGRFLRSE